MNILLFFNIPVAITFLLVCGGSDMASLAVIPYYHLHLWSEPYLFMSNGAYVLILTGHYSTHCVVV